MVEKEKAIEVINKKISALQPISNYKEFDIWQKSTLITITKVIPSENRLIRELEQIKSYTFYFNSGDDRTVEAKKEALALLENAINDIKDFGIQEVKHKENTESINVNVSQNNQQTQTTDININIELIFEAFKDELRGSELEQLKKILESKDEPQIKKKNFIEKVKSFGSDVASNILANILANPNIYTQIISLI